MKLFEFLKQVLSHNYFLGYSMVGPLDTKEFNERFNAGKQALESGSLEKAIDWFVYSLYVAGPFGERMEAAIRDLRGARLYQHKLNLLNRRHQYWRDDTFVANRYRYYRSGYLQSARRIIAEIDKELKVNHL